MRLIAELTASRSRVGLCSTRGTWLNAITPTFTCLGTWERKRKAARLAAVRRFGATSVAVIEPDTSVASMIDARSTGTATVRSAWRRPRSAPPWRTRSPRVARGGASAAASARCSAAARGSRTTPRRRCDCAPSACTGARGPAWPAARGGRAARRSSRRLRAGAELHVELLRQAAALDPQRHRVAGLLHRDRTGQVGRVLDLLAVDRLDHVVLLEARFVGRPGGGDGLD